MSFGIPVRNGLGVGLLASTFLSSLRIGGRPALFLNFIGTNSLDSRITFTRTTTATVTNSSGVIQSAAINEPRFDYDPVTLAPKGLLIEEQRTNLLTYSEEFDNAYWQKSTQGTGIAPVVTANAATAPDGTMTADQVVFASVGTGSGDRSRLLTALLGLGSGTYTVSFWIKAASPSQPNLSLFIQSGVNSLVVVPTTEWVRYTFTATEANQRPELRLSGNVGTLGTYYVWGAQLEAGAFATSYIPTTTTSLTRNADVVSMTGTNFSDWYNASEGAFSATAQIAQLTSLFPIFISANDGTLNNYLNCYPYNPSSPNMVCISQVGGAQQYLGVPGAVSVNTKTNVCFAYKASSFASAMNGTGLQSAATGSIPTVDRLTLGSTTSNYFLNGHLQKINYWPQRLTNNEVQAFSKVG